MAAQSKENELSLVWSKIDEKELVQLAVEMGKTYGPTGYEREIGEYIYNWLESNGFEVVKQPVAGERFNVIAYVRGTGDGLSLLFNSHMDTEFGGPEDIWMIGDQEMIDTVYTGAWLDGNRIHGLGVINDRGLMATFLMAAKAIKNSGVKLKGDLIVTAVVGEIGMAPVDEYQGPEYLGKGVGALHLVNHGVVADYALIAEASNFALTWMENGAGYFKITVKGVGGIYTPHIKRPFPLEENPNAVVKMSKVVQAIEEWALEYEQNNKYEFELGTAVPKVNIGAIRGGLPYKPSKTVGMCCIYVDVRIPPNKNPVSVKRELEQILKKTGIDGKVEMYMFRAGHEGKNIEVLRDAIEKAHVNFFGQKPDKVASVITSVWRDINVFNQVGIPAITYGPGIALTREGVEIDEFIKASKLYAAIALDVCNQQVNT